MGKLIESTFVTLDGVISEPQVWGQPYWDDEHLGYARELLFAADALLLGRQTYDGFAQAWPQRSGDDYTDKINAMPKHVASHGSPELSWNASLIEGDVAAGVRELKKERTLLKFGTGSLDQTLLEHKLVDEYHFWTFPTVAGSGERLFEGVDLTHLELLRTTSFASGIVVSVYGPK